MEKRHGEETLASVNSQGVTAYINFFFDVGVFGQGKVREKKKSTFTSDGVSVSWTYTLSKSWTIEFITLADCLIPSGNRSLTSSMFSFP